jgi:phage-related tail fiber protein
MIIQIGNASLVQLTVDPSVALATNQSIANAMSAHLLAVNPHPQYAKVVDLVQHVMAADPHSQYAKLTDLGAHSDAVDPHPQYMTALETDAAIRSGVPSMAEQFFFSAGL